MSSVQQDFLPSRDLRDLRTLDLASQECLTDVRNNLIGLARVLGASGGKIFHAQPHIKQSHTGVPEEALPSYEEPPRQVDSFEKSYVTRWLTRLISEFTLTCPDDDETAAQAEQLSERCAELLALSAGRMAAGASIQDHVFQLEHDTLTVKLRDGALVHDSLGTHTWGAAPILSQLLLPLDTATGRDLNVLELGAGTGLVGLALAQWSRRYRTGTQTQIICTDYHPTVLENLDHNVALNSLLPSTGTASPDSNQVSIVARCLDWQTVHRARIQDEPQQAQQELTSQTLPSYIVPSEDAEWAQVLDVESCAGTFDLIVAADCVYDPVHPFWIRSVAQKLLKKSSEHGPLLHVMVPLRPTHQQEMQAVYKAFEPERSSGRPQLVILREQDFQGYENFGAWNSIERSESAVQSQPEGGLARTYRWFQIGWQSSNPH